MHGLTSKINTSIFWLHNQGVICNAARDTHCLQRLVSMMASGHPNSWYSAQAMAYT